MTPSINTCISLWTDALKKVFNGQVRQLVNICIYPFWEWDSKWVWQKRMYLCETFRLSFIICWQTGQVWTYSHVVRLLEFLGVLHSELVPNCHTVNTNLCDYQLQRVYDTLKIPLSSIGQQEIHTLTAWSFPEHNAIMPKCKLEKLAGLKILPELPIFQVLCHSLTFYGLVPLEHLLWFISCSDKGFKM